jgi:hypothetical protein
MSVTQDVEKRSTIDVSEIGPTVSLLFSSRKRLPLIDTNPLLARFTTFPGRAQRGASGTRIDSQTEQDLTCLQPSDCGTLRTEGGRGVNNKNEYEKK